MKIIAHRGASGYAPENTILAMKKAVEMGAKAVEFDVQITKDGKVIVFHDGKLGRTVKGKGEIREKTYEELESLDAGEGEKIPLLKEVLEILPKGVTINIELKKEKADKNYDVKKVIQVIKEVKKEEDVTLSSFYHELLEDSVKYGAFPIGLLYEKPFLKKDYEKLKAYFRKLENKQVKIQSINIYSRDVSKSTVAFIHSLGYECHVYTVNKVKKAKRYKAMGVDAIFSNYPDIMNDKR